MLPLTTHCARTVVYQQYLLKEYWAYRIYNALTSKSLRVRLVHITYRDAAGRIDPVERYAFFTEHFDAYARRTGAAVRAEQLFDPRAADSAEVTTFDLFQYAIGNTDFDVRCLQVGDWRAVGIQRDEVDGRADSTFGRDRRLRSGGARRGTRLDRGKRGHESHFGDRDGGHRMLPAASCQPPTSDGWKLGAGS